LIDVATENFIIGFPKASGTQTKGMQTPVFHYYFA